MSNSREDPHNRRSVEEERSRPTKRASLYGPLMVKRLSDEMDVIAGKGETEKCRIRAEDIKNKDLQSFNSNV